LTNLRTLTLCDNEISDLDMTPLESLPSLRSVFWDN